MKSSSIDIVEITLIISDSLSTKIQLNIAKVNNELITQLCNDLSQRFDLNEKTKNKLFSHICKELSIIQKEREKKQTIEKHRTEYFDHLYYYYTSKKQEKEQYYKKLHQENMDKEINQCTFAPAINLKSVQLYKRDYQRIEDKLYREAKVLGIKRLNRNNHKNSNNKLSIDSINQSEETLSNHPKTVLNYKEIKRDEENKEVDILSFKNDKMMHDRLNTQSPKPRNNRNQNKAFTKIQDSYPERLNVQRHSFHMNTVQDNSNSNSKVGFDSGKKGILNPNKYTSNKNQRSILSLQNEQQLFSSKINKRNSNNMIQPVDHFNTQNSNQDNSYKNKFKNKDNHSSSSFTFIISNNDNVNKSNWINRKVKSSSKLTIQKEIEMNRIYKAIYPFKPEISQSSRAIILKKGKENKDSLFKRLSESKRAHSVRNALNNLHSLSNSQHNLNNNSTSNRNTSTHSKKKLIIIKQENKGVKIEPNCETAITTNPQSTSFTERKKKSTEAKQEIEIIQSMKEIESKENNTKKHYKNQYINNLEKFKLNQLKEIYEILTNNGEDIDLEALTTNGIPHHIKEKVIIPTCYMINNKNLEFNFQNFYLIASEILARFF